MSKEIVATDPNADGTPDHESSDGSTELQRDSSADRADETISPTKLVFGMGSAPKSVEPRLEPEERMALEAADVDPALVETKRCSYRTLLDADVDDEVADELRRRFSLPWSFENDGDLDRRSTEVRGLGDAEREWIAVSADETWQTFDTVGAREPETDRDEPTDRPYPTPTPATAVMGVGPDDAAMLAEAGVLSAERLATIDAVSLAAALDFDVIHLRTWRHNARELLD